MSGTEHGASVTMVPTGEAAEPTTPSPTDHPILLWQGSCRSALGAGGWSETPVNSSGTRLTLTLDGGLEGPPRPVMAPYPFPSASSVGVGKRRGSTWVGQFSPP